MKDYLISMFVDDELDLGEKIQFVETVHRDRPFKEETIGLLEQEKLLQGDMVTGIPAMPLPAAEEKKAWFRTWFAPAAGFAVAVMLVVGLFLARPVPREVTAPATLPHRFVIYRPDVHRMNIVGDFTGWSPVPMERMGDSGYWSVTLKVPVGEHRYSYLIDEKQQITDPTVPAREQDDFGGSNSVINLVAAL